MTHSLSLSPAADQWTQIPEYALGLDEKQRRQAALVPNAVVRITTTFYGPDIYNHRGILKAVGTHELYPYAVTVQDVPSYPDAVRNFAWYELEVLPAPSACG